MHNIHYLNKISDKGTALWTEDYTVGAAAEQAEAILVRSASMHEMEFDKELLAIAKKLHERNYFITASYIGEDCLYACDTEEEDMQQFLLYYREPK